MCREFILRFQDESNDHNIENIQKNNKTKSTYKTNIKSKNVIEQPYNIIQHRIL